MICCPFESWNVELVAAISSAMKAHDLVACSGKSKTLKKEQETFLFFFATCFLDGSNRGGGEEENNYHGHRHNFVSGSYSVVSMPALSSEKNEISRNCVWLHSSCAGLFGVVFLNWKFLLSSVRAFDSPTVRVCKCVELVLPQNAHDVFTQAISTMF